MDEEPCARCGIRIPRYELRMLESRLFCIYCYQELLDERRPRCIRCSEVLYDPGHSTSEGFMCFSCYEKFGREKPEVPHYRKEVCEMCGRHTNDLYSLYGHQYCSECYTDEKLNEPRQQGGGIRYAVAEIIKRVIGEKKQVPVKRHDQVPSGIKKQSEKPHPKEKEPLSLKEKQAIIQKIQGIKQAFDDKQRAEEQKSDSILRLLKIRKILPLKKHKNYKKPQKAKKKAKKKKK